MPRALISRRAHHGEQRTSSAAKKGQKWMRRIRKGSQDKKLAAEAVQYEAEERWPAGLTLTHDFHIHYSSSIVLLYPKLYHFFDQIRATPLPLNHHTSFSLHPTPIKLYIFENCKEIPIEVLNLNLARKSVQKCEFMPHKNHLPFPGCNRQSLRTWDRQISTVPT